MTSIPNPAPRVDSHQHFWKYDSVRDGWITEEMKVIQRDFLPEHLGPVLRKRKIGGSVAVQADQSESETEFLLSLTNQNEFIKGVIGWIDLCADNIVERLDYFSSFKKLKGFRHILQAEPKGFMSQKKFLNGISQLEKYNFTYDILIYAHQIDETIELIRHFPRQKFVVDHLAKPEIKLAKFELWAKGITQLASLANVTCKLSGFVTQANWKKWKPEDVYLYLEFALVNFGASRLLYGSDWPVCLLAASYEEQLAIVQNIISPLSEDEQELIMGGNAMRCYDL